MIREEMRKKRKEPVLNNIMAQLNGSDIVRAVGETLQRIDSRLVDHGERVAYIACELREEGNLPLEERPLLLLSLFHDIGAYKTDEIDRMVEFETKSVQNHAEYGYLFLKHMSPAADKAETVLYHHTPWPDIVSSGSSYGEYAALIHLADRMDIIFLNKRDGKLIEAMIKNDSQLFRQEYVDLAFSCFEKRKIFEHLEDGSYHEANTRRFNKLTFSVEDALEYLKMLVYTIDFSSEYTVTHTANTLSIAMNIAQHFELDELEQEKIYLGALLHDVGKIAVPIEILEHPGQLNKEQMILMKNHVSHTEEMIKDIIPEEILLIACRHHEKLDGSGYPHGLTAEDLNFSQRIVAVADIVSALVSRRSYKEPFPKDKTIEILSEMRDNQLDPRICDYLIANYDHIIEETDNSRSRVVEKYQAMLAEYEQLREKHPE